MRKVKRWRYYCDHCGKGGCAGGHIAKHERGCVYNPARECGLCKITGLTQQPIQTLVDAMQSGGIEKVKEAADGCPACTLAAIVQDRRQRGVNMRSLDPDRAQEEYVDFDYRAAHKAFWDAYNEEHEELCY